VVHLGDVAKRTDTRRAWPLRGPCHYSRAWVGRRLWRWRLLRWWWRLWRWRRLGRLVVFALGVALLQWEPFRFAVVPKSVKHARAHTRAVEEFLAQNLHTTKGRTGVLIYVSFAEHFAGLVADNAIDKQVPQETWDQIVRELTDCLRRGERDKGLTAAIEACGKLLAKYFPPGSEDLNELPNHLIVRDAR
jgi:putative membrane protein